MVDLVMVRDERRLALVPATDLDAERLRALPRLWPMQVQTRLSRTSKLNRFWRGIVDKAAAGLDMHPQFLHNEIKFKAGLVEQVFLLPDQRGVVTVKLRSTAFMEMGDDEFSEFVDFGIRCLFRDYLPGIKKPEQRKLIEEWAGRRPKLEEPPRIVLPEGA
jgi:hypothetical protein